MEAFDARALRHFLAVVRTGSIRKAADHLHVAPSAVSRQIADVERRLELPLFERTARGMILTEAGQLMVEHAMRVIEDQDLLTEQLGQLKHVKQGLVRICCGEGFLADLIEHGLTRFSPVYPTIRFAITLGGTDAVLEAIRSGDADIGVVYNPIIDTSVRSLAISRQPLCVITPPGHPLHDRERVSLCDTLDNSCALLTQGHGVRQLVGRVAADNGRALVPILETTSIDVLRRYVSVGQGITFLPRFAVATELARGVVGIVDLTDSLLTEASAHLIVRARRRLPTSVERLAGYLAKEMVAFQEAPQERPALLR
ncbi:LysR family transcriptional regulator [Aliidongia dinghuensis]|uniref:LysR family transcriptional regulator n=1 Tax=Aliidongia dinghuensis TaxID=1867774 RepID=A0A8J3E6L9_9PROT|nr:LysR family transcriptional regulator [Aliidongia dinghuensis]GGF42315.1 LysR family transcriptional regulator [Aliidongia dinghuensis]